LYFCNGDLAGRLGSSASHCAPKLAASYRVEPVQKNVIGSPIGLVSREKIAFLSLHPKKRSDRLVLAQRMAGTAVDRFWLDFSAVLSARGPPFWLVYVLPIVEMVQ
jgi:hypothetical protein